MHASAGEKALKHEISTRERAIAVLKDYSFDPEAGALASTGSFASVFGG
jgi:hypothetical protein